MRTQVGIARIGVIACLTLLLAACSSLGRDAPTRGPIRSGVPVVTDPAPYVSGTLRPYQIRGRWYHPAEDTAYDEVGLASWYGEPFHGRPTATGERFDMNGMTAAHKTLALPALVEVTNLETGRSLILRVNDRGPFVEGRIIDLSRAAADELGLRNQGVGRVRVRYAGRAPRLNGAPTHYAATSSPSVPPAASGPRGTPAPAAPAMPNRTPVWVQVGAFDDHERARSLALNLGAGARMEDVQMSGRPVFRVLVGPWPDANQAEQARLSVVARGYADAILLPGA